MFPAVLFTRAKEQKSRNNSKVLNRKVNKQTELYIQTEIINSTQVIDEY